MVEIEGSYDIAAPPELVWEMILDPDILANVVPGCDRLERIGENEYQGKMRIKVGPVDGVYQGTLKLSDLQPLERIHVAINGRGASGNVRGEGDIHLEVAENGATTLSYVGQGEVSGRIATVGQRLTQSSANAITKQCLNNLDRQIDARTKAPVEEAGEVLATREPLVASAPSQTEFIVGVTRELMDEYIPDPNQRRLLVGVAVLPLLLLFMNWFANLVANRVVKRLSEDHE